MGTPLGIGRKSTMSTMDAVLWPMSDRGVSWSEMKFSIFGIDSMKTRAFQILLGCVTWFVTIGAPHVHADLVKVRFDNMSIATAGGQVFNDGSLQVSRTPLFALDFNTLSRQFDVSSLSTFGAGWVELQYTVSGGTFKDLFDAHKNNPLSPLGTFNPNAGAEMDGVGFDIVNYSGTGGSISIRSGFNGSQLGSLSVNLDAMDGFYWIRDTNFNWDVSTLTFRFDSGGTSSYSIGSIYAVPEATSVLIVAVGIVRAAGTRRRRQRTAR
jgi:hypothetical protein